jgi:hypothetical protein
MSDHQHLVGSKAVAVEIEAFLDRVQRDLDRCRITVPSCSDWTFLPKNVGTARAVFRKLLPSPGSTIACPRHDR